MPTCGGSTWKPGRSRPRHPSRCGCFPEATSTCSRARRSFWPRWRRTWSRRAELWRGARLAGAAGGRGAGMHVEVASEKQAHREGCRRLLRPGFQVLRPHVGIRSAAVGADGAIERRVFRIGIFAIQRRVRAQRRQNRAHQRRIVDQLVRDTLKPLQLLEKLLVARRRRRSVIPAELRRPRARRHQQLRKRLAAPPQQPRQLERHRRSHAVPEKRERLRQVRPDGIGQRRDQRLHALERRFGDARFPPRQPHRADGGRRQRPCGPASRMRKPEQTQPLHRVRPRKPGRSRRPVSQPQRQQAASLG